VKDVGVIGKDGVQAEACRVCKPHVGPAHVRPRWEQSVGAELQADRSRKVTGSVAA